MHILIVTPAYVPAYSYGGPTMSVSMLAKSLAAIGHSVTVYTTTANGKSELDVTIAQPVQIDGVQVFYFARITGDHTHVSPQLWRFLNTTIKNFDVVHLQSWWSLLIFGAAALCYLKKVRYIVSPRGMLSSYTFEHLNGRAKKLLHQLVGKLLLRKSWLHVTSQQEWDECKHFSQGKGFSLPNIVALPSEGTTANTRKRATNLTIGYLSRIDKKKGLEFLLEALATRPINFNLSIAGSGTEDYISHLKDLVNKLGIGDKVQWCGWKSGAEKFEFLRSVDVLALTSQNENFANVIIEALAVGTPVLLSDKVGLAEYVIEKKMGWVCAASAAAIADTLEKITVTELARINLTAPAQIAEDFNANTLAHQYTEAYGAVYNLARAIET